MAQPHPEEEAMSPDMMPSDPISFLWTNVAAVACGVVMWAWGAWRRSRRV